MSDEWTIDRGFTLDGFELAGGNSTVGMRQKRSPKLCKANGNTCKGFKTKGSDFCAGHNRSETPK